MRDETEAVVSDTFIARARAHIEAHEEPLLEYLPADRPVVRLRAVDGYRLIAPDWRRPFTTWREYAAYNDLTPDELMEAWGVDEAGFDAKIANLAEMLPPYATPEGSAYAVLSAALAGDIPESLQAEGHRIHFIEGPYAGSNYMAVRVTSGLALSCLQHLLNQTAPNIRIEVGDEPDWPVP